MIQRGHQRQFHGFTIVELITSVAIIGVVISLTVPALQAARSNAMDMVCQSNLKQMYTGWILALEETNYIIPNTMTTTNGDHWTQLLNRTLPDVTGLSRSKQSTKRFNMCPTIYVRHGGVFYLNTGWGYAINTLWQTPNTTNEYKNWDAIKHPSSYPWFVDPAIFFKGSPIAYHRVPMEKESKNSWGVGIHHAGGTQANVVFADGAVRYVSPDEIDGKAWFENR